ncbi:MAG: peptidyl-prolyl cis-trans isomerase, EpsD family, partial [Azonexaceae bacterium]|nr:peptidyl-prolyl cis-trans isomerase, EpsD family [Azonexaceae bacterium]
ANQRNKEIVDQEMKQLRDKAKIEYLGNFAPAADAKAPPAKPAEPAPKADDTAAGNVGKAIGALK